MSVLTSSATATQERVATRKVWGVGLLGGVIAAVANVIVLLIANGLGFSLEIPMGPNAAVVAPLSAVQVIIASIVPALGAAGLLALLGRFTRRPFTIFLAISVIFLLLSFGPVFGIPAAGSTKVVLGLMHLVAAVPIIGALVTRGREG